jgi:hypothetical protein
MRVDWAILANGAEVRENLAYVLGGGIDTVNSMQLPAAMLASILVRLLVHRSETGRQHTATLRIRDQDGAQIAEVAAQFGVNPPPPDFPVEWEMPVMFAVGFAGLQLPREGPYAIDILGDGNFLTSVHFRVKRMVPQVGQGPLHPPS